MSSGNRPGAMFYFDTLPALEKLPAEKIGTLFLASMKYAQTGNVSTFDDVVLDFAWALIKPSIDRDGERYADKKARGEWLTYCRKCKQADIDPIDFETYRRHTDNGTLRADTDTLPTTSPATNIGTDRPSTRFSPPSASDVEAYCKEKGYHVDAESFVAFYEAKGWYIGKNKMKNWKQAVVTWEKRKEGEAYGGNSQQRPTGQRLGDDRDWTAGFHSPDT